MVSGQESTFQVTPINKYFVMGGVDTDIQFNCTINYGTPIDIATLWLTETTQISNNHDVRSQYAEKYEIEGEFNLVIKNVEASDAILYDCENSLGGVGLIKAFAYLIVFGK